MSDPKRLMTSGGLGRVLLESGVDASPGPDERERDVLWSRLAAELPGLGVGAGAAGALAAAPGAKAALGGAKAMGALALAKGALVILVAAALGTAGSVAIRGWHAEHAIRVAVMPLGAPGANVEGQSERVEAAPLEAWTAVSPAPRGPMMGRDPEGTAATEAAALPPPPRPAQAVAPGVHATPRAVPASPAPAPPLRGEAALLLDARATLRSGDCAKALALVEEAHARFASGSLAEEREVLFIQGLACEGRRDEAEARRADFVRAHPLSAYDVGPGH